MPKDPDNPTLSETIEWLRLNPEFHQVLLKYFEDGRDDAVSKPLSEHGSQWSDAKRIAIAGVYSELYQILK